MSDPAGERRGDQEPEDSACEDLSSPEHSAWWQVSQALGKVKVAVKNAEELSLKVDGKARWSMSMKISKHNGVSFEDFDSYVDGLRKADSSDEGTIKKWIAIKEDACLHNWVEDFEPHKGYILMATGKSQDGATFSNVIVNWVDTITAQLHDNQKTNRLLEDSKKESWWQIASPCCHKKSISTTDDNIITETRGIDDRESLLRTRNFFRYLALTGLLSEGLVAEINTVASVENINI